MKPLISTPFVTSILCVLAARVMGNGPITNIGSEEERENERKTPSPSSADDAISETPYISYMDQIAYAQEFLNENHRADLSRVQCLLRKICPESYHKAIGSLREDQDPKIIYNIFGGVHQHAPNATKAEQKK